jgi:superfamily I DNA/RNA helicase
VADEDMPPLIEPNSAGREGPVPELVKRSSFGHEIVHICDRAQQLQERGIPWNEMAILYRSKWMGERIFREITKANLPVDWLNQDRDSRNFDPSTQSIKLMTMHASKGLEFPVVFIPGLGYLPNQHQSVAEEARLLYVAMTRAIEVLVLTCDRRSRFVERIEGALEKVG